MNFTAFVLVLGICVLPTNALAQHQSSAPKHSPRKSETVLGSGAEDEAVAIKLVDHSTGHPEHFVKFAQCQIEIELEGDGRGLYRVATGKERDLRTRINACVSQALKDGVKVLIMPELTMAFPPGLLSEVVGGLRKTADESGMIVVAGSYYDADRYSRLVVLGPGWEELGYKIRPSRMESCPKDSMGMNAKGQLLVVRSDYGTFAIITCVDLISDEVQSRIRELANSGIIDVVININDNPAAWEFLVEANSIVRRHPIFASVTNVAMPAGTGDAYEGKSPVDHGTSYGNSAIFADLRDAAKDYPDNSGPIVDSLPDHFLEDWGVDPSTGKEVKTRRIPYDHLVGVLPAFQEGMLEYELNIRLKREPLSTNAPDQGYPPIRDLHIVRITTPSLAW